MTAVRNDLATQAAVTRSTESERLQRSVLEVLDEGVLVVGLDGHLLQANASACATLGLDLAGARADPSWWQAFAARRSADGSSLDVGATVVRTARGIRDVEVVATRPDGTTVLLSINYQPLCDDAGDVSGLVLSFRDVTERDRRRRELVESQERLREAHEVAGLASWEWRPETDEVLVFDALPGHEALQGTRTVRSELLAAMSWEGRRQNEDDLDSIIRGERDETIGRYRESRPTGEVWMETRCQAIRDAHGRLLYVRGTSQDVTEPELAKRRAAADRDFLQATLDSLPAHIAVLDEHGEIIMNNRAWIDFGAANGGASTGLGGNYLSACDGATGDEWAARTAAGLRAILSGQESDFSLEYPCVGPTNNLWFVLRAVRFAGSGDARVVVAHDDVTKSHQAEVQVATQAALLDEVDAAVIATDAGGTITHWNRGAERLYGWSAAETVGRPIGPLVVGPADAALAAEIMADVFVGGGWEGEFEVGRKDGSRFPAYVRDALITDEAGRATGVVGVSVDMSERVAAERALRSARNYMRAVADNMGDGLFTLDTEGALIYMNSAAEKLLGWSLDEFKGRTMEHITHAQASDAPGEVSPIVAARRDGETVRVEDGHFVHRDGRELPVAYTAAPFETEDGVEGCVVVFEDISERTAREERLRSDAEKLMWIGRIQDALATDRFVLYAQPIVDLGTGETVQSELLLRLREPDGQIVAPAAFLQIAEQSGLISEVDRWVIRQGAEIAATGRAVEVNLSGRSMGDREVLEHIERCIQACGADPALMVFEITETAIVEDAAAARVFAERLHEMGCKLALDDFGTGYGGFTYLKQIPVDYLKIDIEFVSDLASNPASRHVVEAVVALARGFALHTVAEGVEDAETFALLRELGVDFAQGYHIGRPAPLDVTRTENA